MTQAPLRYRCQCTLRFFDAGRHAPVPTPYQYRAPFHVTAARPAGFDVVDQSGTPINALPMCLHEAERLCAYFSPEEVPDA